MEAQGVQRGPKGAQRGSKGDPRGPKGRPREPKGTPKGAQKETGDDRAILPKIERLIFDFVSLKGWSKFDSPLAWGSNSATLNFS